jgi:hypothetical protein
VGKHSLPDSPAFWRSLLIFGARRFGVVLLILLVALGFWRLVIRRDESGRQPREIPGEDSGILPSIDFSPEPTPSPSPTAAAGRGKIQVLNGGGSAPKATAAEGKLKQAGYEIAARAVSSRPYQRTTIFYQPGSQPAANAIVTLLGVGVVQPAPDNLDKSIPVAVVVGADYPG